MKWYILYVRRFSIFGKKENDFIELYKYKVFTDDIYHVVGYLYCTTLEKIEDVRYHSVSSDSPLLEDLEFFRYK